MDREMGNNRLSKCQIFHTCDDGQINSSYHPDEKCWIATVMFAMGIK